MAGGAPDIAIVADAAAPIGAGDHTRRWALAFPDGVRFAGITRPEGERVGPVLEALPTGAVDRALVQVALAALLSDGAGPHLLDAEGGLTLVLGPHRAIAGAHLAMGDARPLHRVGIVERVPPEDAGVWRWIVDDRVGADGRVGALDALDALPDMAAAAGWRASRGG